QELATKLTALGETLLSVLEKKDAHLLAVTRAQHQATLQKEVRAVREWQRAEADAALEALRAARNTAIQRLQHYSVLLGEQAPAIPDEPADPTTPDRPPAMSDVPGYASRGSFQLVDGGKITVGPAGPGGEALASAL